jgi:hypothetical protein
MSDIILMQHTTILCEVVPETRTFGNGVVLLRYARP